MNITTKIIITDTNIITDLNNAKILEYFAALDNVFISDLIKHDEINDLIGHFFNKFVFFYIFLLYKICNNISSLLFQDILSINYQFYFLHQR